MGRRQAAGRLRHAARARVKVIAATQAGDAGPLVLVALGANLGDATSTTRKAITRLRELASRNFRASSLWSSAPVDCPPGSPAFINAAVCFNPASSETPESLLEKLQGLEKEFGRRPKTVLNEPRPLDLDLIAFGDAMRFSDTLVLPHPRAHLRRFVLEPLREVAPDFILPGQRQSVSQLLAALNSTEVVARIV